jgi:hypothetical protein
MPLISYNTIVRINENKNKQQKQAQPHDTWNTRHARNTCSTNSASESTGSVRDTILRQQDKRERQQQQQYHIKEDACCLFSGPGQNKRSRVFFYMVFSMSKMPIRWTAS